MNYMISDSDFHKIILDLFRVAKRDGIITESEAAIIENVQLNMDKLNQMISQAEEDGFITVEEMDKLHKMKELISMQAYETALQDNVITSHEEALLKTLSKLFKKYVPV